jgi:AcrR family transcriptional regulator
MPGPSPSLTVAQIVDAAVRVADEGGLDAVSMRKVGAELGVAAMALYRYVRTKDELIDAMIDRVLGDEPAERQVVGGWQAALADEAGRLRHAALSHPWVVGLLLGRPSFGPNALRYVERSMASVDGLGLTIDQMLDLTETVHAFTVGFVQAELAEVEAQRRTGLTEAEWRQSVAPVLRALIATGEFPYVDRIVVEAEDFPDSEITFQRRLGYILAGLATSVRATARGRTR